MFLTTELMNQYPLTTNEGWREFVNAPLNSEAPTSGGTQERIQFHLRSLNVETSLTREVLGQVLRKLNSNAHSAAATQHVALTGAPTLGKTTVVTQVGRTINRKLVPQTADTQMPVIYISLEPQATRNQINRELLEFMAAPYGKHAETLNRQTRGLLRDLGVRLVIVDDAHHLDWGVKHREAAAGHLKSIADNVPHLTYLLAGVKLEDTGLFRGASSTQFGGRTQVIAAERFRRTYAKDKKKWRNVLRDLENGLWLAEHESGTFIQPEFEEYLYSRTHGRLGSLVPLIRDAATVAILTGQEHIDIELLDDLDIDFAAKVGCVE